MANGLRKIDSFFAFNYKMKILLFLSFVISGIMRFVILLGIAKNESNQLIGHAWLRSGQLIVTGYRQMNQFKVLAKYAYINR